MAALDPTEARRLTRLRVLLADARRRVDDQSDLGEHLAVIAVDGVGELAIGLCMHKRGLAPKQRESVPEMLARLREHLGVADPPGSRGFRELHRMRNMVQHAGVLPAANQLPLWLAETETLVDFLVHRSFGVDLADISSAAGIRDDILRTGLEDAERALNAGEPKTSFERSWETLQQGRERLRVETGRRLTSFRQRVGFQDIDRPLESLEKGLSRLTEQLEFAAFTSEPAEWLWFEQRYSESRRGPPPSSAEARRALVFVVGWVLRCDSYLARQDKSAWEEWKEQQRAPVTGVPGGPHITGVNGVRPRRIVRAPDGRRTEVEAYEWILPLSDIPETEEPSFDWAITTAARELDNQRITHVHLNASGELSVSASTDVDPAELLDFIYRAIELAKAKLRQRASEREEQLRVDQQLLQPFRRALSEAGVPTLDVSVTRSLGGGASGKEERIWIRIDRAKRGNQSWFAKGLRETFEAHLPELASQIGEGRLGFDDVSVPTTWPADKIALWIRDALAFDRERSLLQEQADQRREEHRADALRQMHRLISEEGRKRSTQ